MTESERLQIEAYDDRMTELRAMLSSLSKKRRAILARVRMRKPKEPT